MLTTMDIEGSAGTLVMPPTRCAEDLPRLSVVLPVYNAERWIEEALESIRAQAYAPDRLEIVVVDDGSTDRSVARTDAILAADPDVRYRVLRMDNGGPSRARNAGWRAATSEWVQFLDADDVLCGGKLELHARATVGLPEHVASVYSDWQCLSRVGASWDRFGPVRSPRVERDPIADLIRPDNFLHLGAQLFRRSWLERVGGFDERHWLIEDVDLMARLAMAGGRFHHVPSAQPLFLYRQQDTGTLSRRSPRAFVEGCVRNARLVEEHWRVLGELSPERARILAEVYFFAARYFASADRHAFHLLVDSIEALAPRFVPHGPPSLHVMSSLLGYRRAETLATFYRGLKYWLRQSLRTGRVHATSHEPAPLC